MKRLTFTGVIDVYDAEVEDPAAWVRMALIYGNKHQDFSSYHTGEVAIEDVEDDE